MSPLPWKHPASALAETGLWRKGWLLCFGTAISVFPSPSLQQLFIVWSAIVSSDTDDTRKRIHCSNKQICSGAFAHRALRTEWGWLAEKWKKNRQSSRVPFLTARSCHVAWHDVVFSSESFPYYLWLSQNCSFLMSVCPKIIRMFSLPEMHYHAHYKASHSEQMHQELWFHRVSGIPVQYTKSPQCPRMLWIRNKIKYPKYPIINRKDHRRG